jgi:hypothetical protein
MKKIEAKFARLRESYVKKTDAFVFAVYLDASIEKK